MGTSSNQSSDWFGNLFGINHWEDRPDTNKSIDEWRSNHRNNLELIINIMM